MAGYAKNIGRAERSVFNEVLAREVYESAPEGELQNYFKHLVAIHD
jgi:hypothetical protein